MFLQMSASICKLSDGKARDGTRIPKAIEDMHRSISTPISSKVDQICVVIFCFEPPLGKHDGGDLSTKSQGKGSDPFHAPTKSKAHEAC